MNPEKDAIERLWDEITPKLYGYLVNTLKNPAIADDILQTAWLKAIEALPQFHDRGHGFSAWIFSIARNEMRMHWRKQGREIPYDPEVHDLPEEEREKKDIFIEQLLQALPEEDRELVRLRYIADLPFNKIAKLLELNPVTVRVKMHRTLARARDILNRKIYE
ncbi:hypothetical protein A2740_01160 [Candidatus Nomurabacteria bacterium RIFCSPHIGHO2_01_FULL_43_16]|nr:MAG: hypothetical protein A2740_01160 [Candidatus Nomurabacteria bacterium RIFCSPHIGHO2_01_FULL_43_16]OGI97596.1 MAG: hypothetical protein A3A11_01940 [Candidatus Nomurabacteria bacterium RIFCSPLOWO2_01_FULL_43_15]